MIRLAALCLLAGPALAEDWRPLSGTKITAALTARVLGFDDGSLQDFFADGRTLFTAGDIATWGAWRVDGNRYCSQWPPQEGWDCYGVEAEARGLDLRFVGEGGDVSVGRYVDLR